MKVISVALVSFLALAFLQPGSGADPATGKKTLDELIFVYDHTNCNPDENQLVAMGQEAVTAIYDAMYLKVQQGGARTAIRPGISNIPRQDRYGRLGFAGTVLLVTAKIDAPIPVERLCKLVDEGCCFPRGSIVGQDVDAAVFRLLAASGHPKALIYLQRCQSLLKNCRTRFVTQEMLATMEQNLAYWKAANTYVRTGTSEGDYQPVAATRATRAQYQQNPESWGAASPLDDRYLSERLAAVTAMLNNEDKRWFVNLDGIGLWYEALLLPRVQAWLDGDQKPLVAVLGDPAAALAAVGEQNPNPNACVRRLIGNWTDPAALPVFLKLMKADTANDVLPYLLPYKPEMWYAEYLKEHAKREKWSGLGLLPIMATFDRPYDDDEKAIMAKALCQPRIPMRPRESGEPADFGAACATLARREPQLFRDALKTEHMSAPVINAILQEKLCDDTGLLLQKIQYAMAHDCERGVNAITPERLAQFPPEIAARVKAGIEQQMKRPKTIEQDWIDLIQSQLKDHQPVLQFLRTFSDDPHFAKSKTQVDAAIASLLKLHPDWK
jgi:hypothetical protein